MTNEEKAKSDPLKGTIVTSTIATGGGGGVFQSRVGALYLANMLTGLPTAFSLHGCQVEELRFEARYAGAHTDDIYCKVRSSNGNHLLACALIQRWPSDSSEALQWARTYLLEVAARQEDKDAWVLRGSTTGELRARTLILLASVDPKLSKMAEGLANIVTEPVWKVRRAAANTIAEVLRLKQPVLADLLTSALSQYAEALDTTNKRPRRRSRDIVDDARPTTVKAVLSALSEMKPPARAMPKSLAAVKEWTIALDAARGETPDTWRIQALTALIRLMADQEGKPQVQRNDPDHVDYEARWEAGELLAAELLEQTTEQSPPFELLDFCLEYAPELSERVLESTLGACMKQEFANADAFWRVWDRAAAKVLPDESLRTRAC